MAKKTKRVEAKPLDFIDLYYVFKTIGVRVTKNRITHVNRFSQYLENIETFNAYCFMIIEFGAQLEECLKEMNDRNRVNLYKINKYLLNKYSKAQIKDWNINYMSESDVQKLTDTIKMYLFYLKVHVQELNVGSAAKVFSGIASLNVKALRD